MSAAWPAGVMGVSVSARALTLASQPTVGTAQGLSYTVLTVGSPLVCAYCSTDTAAHNSVITVSAAFKSCVSLPSRHSTVHTISTPSVQGCVYSWCWGVRLVYAIALCTLQQ